MVMRVMTINNKILQFHTTHKKKKKKEKGTLEAQAQANMTN